MLGVNFIVDVEIKAAEAERPVCVGEMRSDVLSARISQVNHGAVDRTLVLIDDGSADGSQLSFLALGISLAEERASSERDEPGQNQGSARAQYLLPVALSHL